MEPPFEPSSTSSKRRGVIARVGDWYTQWERPISSISLVGGFVFDALTLTRVDLFWENVWVVVHIAAVAISIFLINLTENMRLRGKDPARIHFWLINICQFFFGGILSTFLVYYFRAGSIAVSWPFMAILAAAFVANERLKQHYSRLVFQITLLFLCIFAFAIFIVPVMLHAIGTWIFILSGIVSLLVIGLFLLALWFAAQEQFRKSRWPLFVSLGIVFVGVNLLYFYNFIPPLPLSLKGGDVYHSLTVNAPGHYTVTQEQYGFWSFLDVYRPVTLTQGSPLFAYTAIFSPALFHLTIVHQWQHYDPSSNSWMTVARVALPVAGGNDGGWRTFSEVIPQDPGKWRVNVETTDGAIIGRLDFAVTFSSSTPPLVTSTVD